MMPAGFSRVLRCNLHRALDLQAAQAGLFYYLVRVTTGTIEATWRVSRTEHVHSITW